MAVERLKAEIVAALDFLPPDSLEVVQKFVRFLREQTRVQPSPPYTPVALRGLWKGVEISDEDIASVRQEMWAVFEDKHE